MKTKTVKKPDIRYDIWAIKEWDSSIGTWSFVLMSYDRRFAIEQLGNYTNLRNGTKAKLVHPAKWVVEGFVTYGNKIWRRGLFGME